MNPLAPLRPLDVDLPAQPAVLARLTAMLGRPETALHEIAALIEGDMALAAALLKTVNSAYYGLGGTVRTVQQAATYLGLREVGAMTLQLGLRAMFPTAPELDALWDRAGARGRRMAKLAPLLGADPWEAHSAGLFEECGKAVLFRLAADRYRGVLRAAVDDAELLFLEHGAFGVSHDVLGASLCETWGLAPASVHSVRHHVQLQADLHLPRQPRCREVAACSVLAHGLQLETSRMEVIVGLVAAQFGRDRDELLAAIRREGGDRTMLTA